MHVEFDLSWWSTKLWWRRRWRRKWRRTLIRLHLRKPYDGPNHIQMFGTLKLSHEKQVGQLYGLTPDQIPLVNLPDLFDAHADKLMDEFMGLSTKEITKRE